MIKNRHNIEGNEHKSPPLYPEAAQVEVSDNYSGVQVTDPYRWLENLASQGVREWVEAPNIVESHPLPVGWRFK
jgi:Prolyl oligopeptidase, N-terminal beta-propeller domain